MVRRGSTVRVRQRASGTSSPAVGLARDGEHGRLDRGSERLLVAIDKQDELATAVLAVEGLRVVAKPVAVVAPRGTARERCARQRGRGGAPDSQAVGVPPESHWNGLEHFP